jgi:hypothetical protein
MLIPFEHDVQLAFSSTCSGIDVIGIKSQQRNHSEIAIGLKMVDNKSDSAKGWDYEGKSYDRIDQLWGRNDSQSEAWYEKSAQYWEVTLS